MAKIKYAINPSSLGSYFGVGFNTPQEQFDIDLGLVEREFTEEEQDRLDLGNYLEDAVLNLFEKKLGIIITDRNEKTIEYYDGKIRGKVDGLTVLNGINTVVENKVSNATSYRFTENLGYLFQCQSYLIAYPEYEQVLLCGLYQGKPIYKIIQKDQEMINDIKEMTDFVVDCLAGFETFDNFPQNLLDKYAKSVELKKIEDISEEEKQAIHKLVNLKEEVKKLYKEIDVCEGLIKNKYLDSVYQDDYVKMTIQTQTRKGGFDLDKLSIEHPEIDYSKYNKPDTNFSVLRVSKVKPKKSKGE